MYLTFGEIMMRVAPPEFLRFRQAMPGSVDITFAGGEANVAASLANFGGAVRYLTALPKNPIAECCERSLNTLGIDTSHILKRAEGRLGVYFLETGANQRSSNVVYDRDGSAVSLAAPDEYDFDAALNGVSWVVESACGGTPTPYCSAGISASGCQASISAAGLPSTTAASGFQLMASGVEGGCVHASRRARICSALPARTACSGA